MPQAAVLRGAQGFYFYVVNTEDNSVSTRIVNPGVIDGVDRLRDGAKVEVIAADPKQRAGATGGGERQRGTRGTRGPAGSASAPASSASVARAASCEARPAWLDRLPPDVTDQVMKMSPDERKAWIEKRRAERAAGRGNSGGCSN